MTFLRSFSNVLRMTMSLKTLGESYKSLLGLEMMMDVDTLKCKDQ